MQNSPRLNADLLAHELPAKVDPPGFDAGQHGAGIVHLGLGAFHRGHQAWYTNRLLEKLGGDWMISGASLRSPAVRDQLRDQDYLYSLVERDAANTRIELIASIKDMLVATENQQDLIDLLAADHIQLVTLTITEKGYCHQPATGELDAENRDIVHDLQQFPREPVSAIGYLVASLDKRRNTGGQGITLLSCDNLPGNGRLLRRVVLDFAARVDKTLCDWISQNCTFPCSMVDRIVPATTPADLQQLQDLAGYRDEAAVFTEPFSQWVIEDRFAGRKPDWASVGALLVEDVEPFEEMKLRLLNGSHSIIAYLGCLAGYEYVHEVVADPLFRRLIENYMQCEAAPTLKVPDDFDLDAYIQSLLTRFSNPALNHRTSQIAQDGSQKIPQRWLAVARARLAAGESAEIVALAVAGWARFLEGCTDAGKHYEVTDPLADALCSVMKEAQKTPETGIEQLFGIKPVFGDLAERYPDFVKSVQIHFRALQENGVVWLLQQHNDAAP